MLLRWFERRSIKDIAKTCQENMRALEYFEAVGASRPEDAEELTASNAFWVRLIAGQSLIWQEQHEEWELNRTLRARYDKLHEVSRRTSDVLPFDMQMQPSEGWAAFLKMCLK